MNFKTFLPTLLRPVIWPDLCFLVCRRANLMFRGQKEWRKIEKLNEESANDWCRTLAIPFEEAMTQLRANEDIPCFEEKHHLELRDAERRASACKLNMGGAANLNLLYMVCEKKKVRVVIETGVAFGWSSLAILLSIQSRPNSMLYSVDRPYIRKNNDQWVGVVVPENLRNWWKLYRMNDRKGLPKIVECSGPVDLVHYDSDKSVDGRMFAYNLLWQVLRPGGVLISDDVGDNLGFKSFCDQNGLHPLIVEKDNKFQGILFKAD